LVPRNFFDYSISKKILYLKKTEKKESLIKMLVNDEEKECAEIDLNNNEVIEPIKEITEIKSSPQPLSQESKDAQK
jgi:hypothetical protein